MTSQKEAQPASAIEARRWRIDGQVQGVGFRPFVFRLAHKLGLAGEVCNRMGEVEVWCEGPRQALDDFATAILNEAPPLARPRIAETAAPSVRGLHGFEILESNAQSTPAIHMPVDRFCCEQCLRELADPGDRRYRYPFINCTQCGPRYTLIAHLPWDRANTSMARFALCPRCHAEYENPGDRRFHAEPLACPDCGPRLWLATRNGDIVAGTEPALADCVARLKRGEIVAVKGVGGYHLMTDARNDAAVQRLRQRKQRPHKPLAVMFAPDTEQWHADIAPDACAAAALVDPARPVVLVARANNSQLAPSIAPGLDEVGAMTAYSPLHHLLLADFCGPLVATSANMSGEPVMTDAADVEARLAGVADSFLHHDRPILRPADDPVLRVIDGSARPLRLGRGNAPLELTLPSPLRQPLLAVGGHMKNTIALAWEDRAVISPHIGDFGSPRTLAVFERTIAELQALYGVHAQRVICDAHPAYASSRWARASGLPVTRVFHHRAHASALAGEYPHADPRLVFTWDGTGYGEDGTLWGGEALIGGPGNWRRVATMRPFHLPGGDRAAHEPWRCAAALSWEIGAHWPADALVFQAWQRRLNAPRSSAVGRLFDAAAALTGLLREASHDAQAPMQLEAIAEPGAAPIELPREINAQGLWQIDWAPLVKLLSDTRVAPAARAGIFHASLAYAALAVACALRQTNGVDTVGLTGGVFQNQLLTATLAALLRAEGFTVQIPSRLPCNDAGIAFGQVVEAGAAP